MKNIIIYGGGTFSPVRSHLALAAPAFGETARTLYGDLVAGLLRDDGYSAVLKLTKMADPESSMMTNEDVENEVEKDILNPETRCIIFNVAMCDYNGSIDNVPPGKYAPRLQSRAGPVTMALTPARKVLKTIRRERKDIFLVGFKTTSGASLKDQYITGLNLLKETSCNLVFCNDVVTRANMIVTPEETHYPEADLTSENMSCFQTRHETLMDLNEIMLGRLQCTFTRSIIVPEEDKAVPWRDGVIPASLKKVVDHCIKEGAYKPFRGSTAGHFAYKVDDTGFITSKRKTDFNRLSEVGMVYVESLDPDTVVAYGAKPSVGGQSQRIIFRDHPEAKYIVHFHSPPKDPGQVPVAEYPQKWFECGSHECGENTSYGLAEVGRGIKAVYLENHGPNIVFSDEADPDEVIRYIDTHFDLASKTGGLVT